MSRPITWIREARDFLIAGLRRFRGIGIVVSHDRAMLDALCAHTRCASIAARARIWRGSYSDAKRSWEAEEHEHRTEHERLQHEHQKLRRRAGRQAPSRSIRRHEATPARAIAHEGPARSRRDQHDGRRERRRCGLARPRATSTVDARQNRARRRASSTVSNFRKHEGPRAVRRLCCGAANRVLGIDAEGYAPATIPILREVHLSVFRGDKIRIAGPNGIGKTTLLKAMVASARIASSRLLYLAAGTQRR